jgi:hypothetical protein
LFPSWLDFHAISCKIIGGEREGKERKERKRRERKREKRREKDYFPQPY